jgi:hypothetical protein
MTITNTSVDKTSHPGKSGTDELARSGYPLRVGEIDAGGQRWDDVDTSRGVGRQRLPTHVPFPVAGRVAVTRDVFRWVPVYWAH